MMRHVEFLGKIHKMEERSQLKIKNMELKIDNLILKISPNKSEK